MSDDPPTFPRLDAEPDELGEIAGRLVTGQPVLGSRRDRQEQLGQQALAYIMLSGLGVHFHSQVVESDVSLTQEESKELREREFDPLRNAHSHDLKRYVERMASENRE